MKAIVTILSISLLLIAVHSATDTCPDTNSVFFDGLTSFSYTVTSLSTTDSSFSFAFNANNAYGTTNLPATCLNITATTTAGTPVQMTVTNGKTLIISQSLTITDIINLHKCTSEASPAGATLAYTLYTCSFTMKIYQIANGISGTVPLATSAYSFSVKYYTDVSQAWTIGISGFDGIPCNLCKIFTAVSPTVTGKVYSDAGYSSEAKEFRFNAIAYLKIDLSDATLKTLWQIKHVSSNLMCADPTTKTPNGGGSLDYPTSKLATIDMATKGTLKYGLKLKDVGTCTLSTLMSLVNAQPTRLGLLRKLADASTEFGGTFKTDTSFTIDGMVNKAGIGILSFLLLFLVLL